MGSLKRLAGELLIDHANSPGIPPDLAGQWNAQGIVTVGAGQRVEMPTYTCRHCNTWLKWPALGDGQQFLPGTLHGGDSAAGGVLVGTSQPGVGGGNSGVALGAGASSPGVRGGSSGPSTLKGGVSP